MLKIIANGILNVFIYLSIVYIVAGNIYLFMSWLKSREKKKNMGIQYYYLDFWGDFGEYTAEEIEELHQILEKFEEKGQIKIYNDFL